jgi:hypothetical protein
MNFGTVKDAVITAATVLVVIYALRQVPMVNGYVDKALRG